jgi:hypothetical protein
VRARCFDGTGIDQVRAQACPRRSPAHTMTDAQAFRRDVADEVVCLETPRPFFAVGQFYEDFSQVSDEQVQALLDRAAVGGQGPPVTAGAADPAAGTRRSWSTPGQFASPGTSSARQRSSSGVGIAADLR